MRTRIGIAIFTVVALCALPVVAHHMAEGIVDEEIYAQIDEMVADTPHSELDFTDLGGGMTEITMTTRVPDLETLVAAGFLDYVAMLDGDVTLTIDFADSRDLDVTILQLEDVEGTDKADDGRDVPFGTAKAEYR